MIYTKDKEKGVFLPNRGIVTSNNEILRPDETLIIKSVSKIGECPDAIKIEAKDSKDSLRIAKLIERVVDYCNFSRYTTIQLIGDTIIIINHNFKDWWLYALRESLEAGIINENIVYTALSNPYGSFYGTLEDLNKTDLSGVTIK